MPVSSLEKPLPSVSVVESPAEVPRTPTPHLAWILRPMTPIAPREFERLITHSEDFRGELRGRRQVQVDWRRAEGVGLGLYNKWLRGGTTENFPSTGGLNFPSFQRSM